MNGTAQTPHRAANFELRFQSLFNEGRALAFPCDATGQVNMDAMTDRARNNDLCARTTIGREYSTPTLRLTVST